MFSPVQCWCWESRRHVSAHQALRRRGSKPERLVGLWVRPLSKQTDRATGSGSGLLSRPPSVLFVRPLPPRASDPSTGLWFREWTTARSAPWPLRLPVSLSQEKNCSAVFCWPDTAEQEKTRIMIITIMKMWRARTISQKQMNYLAWLSRPRATSLLDHCHGTNPAS